MAEEKTGQLVQKPISLDDLEVVLAQVARGSQTTRAGIDEFPTRNRPF